MSIEKDELVVMFCNKNTYAGFPENTFSEEAVVLTELLQDGQIIVVPAREFVDWLYEGGQQYKS